MDYYDEIYPTSISYERYEQDIHDKEIEIINLQEENYKLILEIEDVKEIIKNLKGELKLYERIIKENNISL